MRARKRSVTPKALVLGLASHAAMGIALGLAFAFVVTRMPWFGVAALINGGTVPEITMTVFACICATMFGVGATLTGLLLMVDDG